MIHYHGGPITPETCAIRAWRGRHAFISYAHPHQIGLAAEYCQSFALDNGAFSFWKSGRAVDWPAYYGWVDTWRTHPGFDFAVIPDVIEGSEEENDALVISCPLQLHEGAPVWHINESFDRFLRLARKHPRVCIGSSGQWDVSSPKKFLPRVIEAIRFISDASGRPICKLHGLRMLNPAVYSKLPLKTADSVNVGMNIGIDKAWKGTYQPASKETRATVLVERIEQFNGASCVEMNDFDMLLAA